MDYGIEMVGVITMNLAAKHRLKVRICTFAIDCQRAFAILNYDIYLLRVAKGQTSVYLKSVEHT